MKKGLIITLLITSMLFMVGFAPTAGQSYWEEMKKVYEWDAMEGDTDLEVIISVPGQLEATYNITMYSQTDLEAFVSYIEMEVEIEEADETTHQIPTVKMYTKGSNIYINTDLVVHLLSLAESELPFETEAEYIMLQSGENNMNMDLTSLTDIIGFLENMDLGIDLGMTQEGDTYSLRIESDKMIDLLDVYIKYVITNMDQLTNLFMQGDVPEEMVLTEEQQAEMLEMYEMYITPQKDMAKGFILGSYYDQVTTFHENSYTEDAELFFTTPMGKMHIDMISSGQKLDTTTIELPTSVMVITEDELTNLMISGFGATQDMPEGSQLQAIVDLQGDYMKITEGEVLEGNINLKVEEGRSYIVVEDIQELLDIEFEGLEGFMMIQDLEQYGYQIQWNPDSRTIEIYN
ncbi:hypothetical protein Amet_2939 [Alkaliphilus metalliredigens QYMF]|uniref:Copper amine oxidase-like N-terminal domain-containing protein n=1 Tax=Alkaliphilus metalliredigens (strain QYMF) TaxID=293826 RepID=A6TSC1_ALKMQ|nr:hypothetical protein [Alkaliphilus metalliredigens]ABR49089.1 hypothetical protein Amet_2939 [Alkaliphilus metalliredigens QYMF]